MRNTLNRLLKIAVIASCCVFLRTIPAKAQSPTYTSPITDQETAFTNQSTPTTFAVHNLGQNIHFVFYTYTSSQGFITLDLRLEGSNDGSTWFPISEDSTAGQGNFGNGATSGSGALFAPGSYAAVRVNLVAISVPGGQTGTVSASYSGTSSVAGPLLGTYSVAQQYTKLIVANQASNTTILKGINSPTGSTLGYIILIPTPANTIPSGSSAVVSGLSGVGSPTPNGCGNIPATTSLAIVCPVSGTSVQSQQINVAITTTGGGTGTYTAYYCFLPPGSPSVLNSPVFEAEFTSAANAAVSQVLSQAYYYTNLWSVSARCSAGTAQLTVSRGGAQVWSTAATEVSTTTFRYQWNPGLQAIPSFNGGVAGFTVTLSTCGVSNTGTLDVEYGFSQ